MTRRAPSSVMGAGLVGGGRHVEHIVAQRRKSDEKDRTE